MTLSFLSVGYCSISYSESAATGTGIETFELYGAIAGGSKAGTDAEVTKETLFCARSNFG